MMLKCRILQTNKPNFAKLTARCWCDQHSSGIAFFMMRFGTIWSNQSLCHIGSRWWEGWEGSTEKNGRLWNVLKKLWRNVLQPKGRKLLWGKWMKVTWRQEQRTHRNPRQRQRQRLKARRKDHPQKKCAPSGASEAGDVSENQASPKKRAGKGGDVSKKKASPKKRADKGGDVSEKKASPKKRALKPGAAEAAEKRRARVDLAFAKLKEVMPYMLPNGGLKGRQSFTLKDPKKEGSSVGVILCSSSFYVAKAVEPKHWPTDCAHLQVGMCHVGFETFLSFCSQCFVASHCHVTGGSKARGDTPLGTLPWCCFAPCQSSGRMEVLSAASPNQVNHIWFNLECMGNPLWTCMVGFGHQVSKCVCWPMAKVTESMVRALQSKPEGHVDWEFSQTCISLVFIWFKFWVQLMLGRLQDDCNCFYCSIFARLGFSVNCIQICGSTCAGLVQSAFIRAWLSCNFSDGALSFLESLIWFAGKFIPATVQCHSTHY